MRKCVQAVIKARSESAGYVNTALVFGDLYMLLDGSQAGNATKFKVAFRDESDVQFKKEHKVLHVGKSEDGITRRVQHHSQGRRCCEAVRDVSLAHAGEDEVASDQAQVL